MYRLVIYNFLEKINIYVEVLCDFDRKLVPT